MTEKHEKLREADRIYARLVIEAGLYGVAFFGHARSEADNRCLRLLWTRARKEAGIV